MQKRIANYLRRASDVMKMKSPLPNVSNVSQRATVPCAHARQSQGERELRYHHDLPQEHCSSRQLRSRDALLSLLKDLRAAVSVSVRVRGLWLYSTGFERPEKVNLNWDVHYFRP